MEIENAPQMDRRGKMAFQDITAVKKSPSTSGSVNAGTLMSGVNRTSGFSQKSHPVSPSKISEAGKPSECASHHQSNPITNYFPVARKRYVEMFLTLLPLLLCWCCFWKIILTQGMYI